MYAQICILRAGRASFRQEVAFYQARATLPRRQDEVLQPCPQASRAPKNGCVGLYIHTESGKGVTKAGNPLPVHLRKTSRHEEGVLQLSFQTAGAPSNCGLCVSKLTESTEGVIEAGIGRLL